MKYVKRIITIIVICIFSLQMVACVNYEAILSQVEDIDSVDGEQSSTDDSTELNINNNIKMSDKLFDFTIRLEGVVFQLPCTYKELTDAGWAISTSEYSDKTMIAGNSYDTFYMTKGEKQIFVYFYNMSGNACAISDCKVGGFDIGNSDNVQVELAKGITLNSDVEDIIAAYGTPSERSTYDEYEAITYRYNESYYNDVEFTCYTAKEDKKYSSVIMQNFVETSTDQTETNSTRPDYLEQYVGPKSLGTKLLSGNISIDGELYHLPAPVSEFVDNGWSIVQQPGGIGSGNRDSIRIKKVDKELSLDIINYAQYQTTAENCVVYAVYIYDNDEIDVVIPTGISFNSSKDDVENVINDDFSCYENMDDYSYSYSEYDSREYSLSIRVSKKTRKVSTIQISCKTWDY